MPLKYPFRKDQDSSEWMEELALPTEQPAPEKSQNEGSPPVAQMVTLYKTEKGVRSSRYSVTISQLRVAPVGFGGPVTLYALPSPTLPPLHSLHRALLLYHMRRSWCRSVLHVPPELRLGCVLKPAAAGGLPRQIARRPAPASREGATATDAPSAYEQSCLSLWSRH